MNRPEQRTQDYTRYGTTTLFAALEVATGRVTNRCAARHRHQESLGFLKQLARTYPRRVLHLVCDNYATTSTPRSALARQPPRVQLHFTPTSASWLNLVYAAWNQRCQPFSWTKSADEILTKLNRQTTSATQH